MSRHTFPLSLFVVVLGSLTSGSLGAAADPAAIFWASDPVRPGEVVLVQGARWGEQPRLELSWLRDAALGNPVAEASGQVRSRQVLTPLQVTESSIKFLVPENWNLGLYSLTVDNASGRSAPVLLNAPDPWWQQGDWGKEASPGGWLRVFGKCLSLEGRATVALRGRARTITLRPTQQDLWSLTCTPPENLPPGEYQTWVHNGAGGPAGWKLVGSVTIRPHPPLWKPDVFDVRDFGAVPSSHLEATVAVQAALDAAGANGGGIVHFPRGRFQINDTLSVPRFVLLRGEGADLTQLYWRDRDDPLDTLIRGTNSFGVEDLSVLAFNHIGGLVADPGDRPDAGNVFFRRLHLHLNRFEQVTAEEAARRLLPMGGQGTHGTYALAAGGDNVQVTDCRIYSSRAPFAFNHLRYGLIRGNHCFQGDTSHGLGGRQVIFEDNVVQGGPVARGGYQYVERNLYYARNRIGAMSLHDAELFTTDGGNTVLAKIASADGTRLTLEQAADWDMWTRRGTRGLALFITHGTGAGQYRLLTSHQGTAVEIERPWDLPPDQDSTLIICPYFTRGLLLDNDFHDGAIVQNYCWGMDWVFSGNRSSRTGGIHSAGRGRIPNWYSQYFDNEITVGTGARGPWNQQPPVEAHLQVIGDSARGAVFRRNVLHGNARLEVTQAVRDVVMDHNLVRDADAGIVVEPRSEGVLLWDNRFERVLQPLVGVTDRVYLHPAERLQAHLAAEGLLPAALPASSAWRAACRRLEQLRATEPHAPGLEEAVQACRLELLRAAAEALPQGQPLELLQALTGLTLEEVTPPALQALLVGASGGSAETTLVASLPAWSLPMTVSLRLPPLPGWETAAPAPLNLTPGAGATTRTTLTFPAGVWGKPTVPLTCLASGPDWELRASGRLQLGARTNSDYVTQWMVVGPFEAERPGFLGETVYPPERRLDLAREYPGLDGPVRWQPVELSAAPWAVDLTSLYGSREQGVAFGVAVLRVARPTTVMITSNPPGGSTYAAGVTYLNGKLLGIPARYGALRVSRTLAPGDHVLLCGAAQSGSTWQLAAQVETDPAAAPGDVQVLPVSQFSEVAAVSPGQLAPLPEGPDLPFSDGYDWKLVFDDDFNRVRLGREWLAYEPQAWYEGKSWRLRDGYLSSGGSSYFEYLTCDRPLTPPVRVEADVTGDPERLPAWLVAFTLTPRNQIGERRLWGNVNGAGYMLTVGWNPAGTNRLWRKSEELQVSHEGPFLQPGVTRHVIAQFSPERLLLVIDGQVSLDYRDPEWLSDLDTFSLMNGFGRDWIDNVRIYTAAEQ